MIFTLAARELRSMFLSPMAWVILAVISGLCAYFFLLYIDLYLQLQPRLAAAANGPGVTDIIVVPLLSTAAIPPCAAPLWERRGWTLERTAISSLPSPAVIAAHVPARPAPTMMMSCVMVSEADICTILLCS